MRRTQTDGYLSYAGVPNNRTPTLMAGQRGPRKTAVNGIARNSGTHSPVPIRRAMHALILDGSPASKVASDMDGDSEVVHSTLTARPQLTAAQWWHA
jgi:hypothetical protein